MVKVIGVKFKNSGKSYFFDPAGFDVHKDDHVIVETGKGIDYGTVVSDIREMEDEKVFYPLKPIMRIATPHDEEQVQANHEKEKEAFRLCLEKVHEHNLDMKLTEVEYAFDNSKILFYFTADGYVDFRELVKDLAGIFRTRIELRQIGVRDEARALGGLGACGRPMCCATFLPDFVPVSIKMAKEQNLPLNPTKISGVCGRLMCCLKNEEETYEELNKSMPDVGDFVEGDDGLQGDVFSTNVLRQMVKVLVEVGGEKEMHDYAADQITVLRKRKGKKNNVNRIDEAVDEKQLAALEDKPEKSEVKDNNREKKDRGNRDNNGPRENNKNRENRDNKENRDNRENAQAPSEGNSVKENNREHHGNRENRDNREGRDNRRNREGRENRDHRNGDRDHKPQNQNFEKKENENRVEGETGNGGNGNRNNRRHHGHHHDRNKGNRNDNNSPAKGNGEN